MVLLRDVAALWMAEHRTQVSETTWRDEQLILDKHLLPDMGGADLLRFNKRRLDDYRRGMARKGVKPVTFKKHLTIIYGILNYAVRAGLLESFPNLEFSYPKIETVINRPDAGKLSRLLAEQRGEVSALIVLLAWQLGLMRNEIQALNWSQVDFSQAVVRLERHSVPLPAYAADVLEELRAEQSYSVGVVVRSVHGKPITREYVSMLAHNILTKYDMPEVRLMDLRHDFVIRSLLVYPPAEVASMIGLKNPDDLLRLYREYIPDEPAEPLLVPAPNGKVGRDVFVYRMAKLTGLTQKQCQAALDAMLEAITQALSKHDSVALDGFGIFSVNTVEARPCWDFHKNESMISPAHNVINFVPDKHFFVSDPSF